MRSADLPAARDVSLLRRPPPFPAINYAYDHRMRQPRSRKPRGKAEQIRYPESRNYALATVHGGMLFIKLATRYGGDG